MQLFFEGLLKGYIDGSYGPSLAETWEVDPNGPSATFHLRHGVKLHDGSDFNAELVK
jgi:peptide/nickel transport system substrate-binding protein